MYEYACIVKRIVDGDTVDVDIDLGFDVWLQNERVRIVGINTPEIRTRDLVEKKYGIAATERAEQLLPVDSKQILLSQNFKGKFGRILGDFRLENTSFSKQMLAEGHAVPYK